MATPFDEVYDLYLTTVQDYKLDELNSSSPANFSTFLQGILIRSIPKFLEPTHNLEDYTLTPTPQFNETLDLTEKVILADLMVLTWFEREINNVTQFNLLLNDTDFKRYAESQNLREKSEYFDRLREKVKQDMIDYALKNVQWTDWAGQVFDNE